MAQALHVGCRRAGLSVKDIKIEERCGRRWHDYFNLFFSLIDTMFTFIVYEYSYPLILH